MLTFSRYRGRDTRTIRFIGGSEGIGGGSITNPGMFNAQTGTFSIEWDAVPSASPIDVVTGVSNGVPTGFSSLACTIIFASDGLIKSRSGSTVAAANTVNYVGGVSYHCRMVVDVAAKTYSSWVKAAGQTTETQIANLYAFRTEQNTVPQLDYLGRWIGNGDVAMTNMIGPPVETGTPVVANKTFQLTTSGSSWTGAGTVVGTMTATRSPTDWFITGGNSSGYYAITLNNGNGVITVTSAGATALAGSTSSTPDSLTVRADNQYGTGTPGTATINRAPASTLAFPKSMTDPMFTNMVEQNSRLTTANGATYNNYSWLDHYNVNQSILVSGSNITFNKLRMRTNEGIRMGSNNTNIIINQMYMEVYDPDPVAHADGTQWFTHTQVPPGPGPYPGISRSVNSMTFKNCHLRGLNGCYTLMLIADWSCGEVIFENCLFTTSRQGCQGFVFNPQDSTLPDTITVSVKDCWVQADDWGNGGSSFNGACFKINTTTGASWYIHPCTVSLWQNVNYCTWDHSTGVLTPGAAYPKPPGVL